MERCLEKQNSQAFRLLNNTGISSIPAPTLDGLDNELYNELLHNASILYNETLITCNKTEFLTVRGKILEHYKDFVVLSTERLSFSLTVESNRPFAAKLSRDLFFIKFNMGYNLTNARNRKIMSKKSK